MKNYLIPLISTFSIISAVHGKIPEWIHICKQNDPDLTACVLKSILDLKDNLIEGIPQLAVPPIDPLYLEKLELNLGPGFKAEGRDLILKGGRNFDIRNLVVDIKENTYAFSVWIPEIAANGTYEVDARIASIPIRGKGPIHLTAKSISGHGTMYGKKVVRGGNTFNTFPKMSMKLEFNDYDIRLENLFEGDPTIGEVTNKLLNEEKAEVIASLLPGLEKALIKHILTVANGITKTFTWDELFPES